MHPITAKIGNGETARGSYTVTDEEVCVTFQERRECVANDGRLPEDIARELLREMAEEPPAVPEGPA